MMEVVLAKINAAYPLSPETEQALKESVTECRFPRRYQLVRAGIYCKYAYFIEQGMTRSFWLVNGEEITTSFSCEGGIVFSMDGCASCSRPTSNWPIGDASFIRTNTDGCTVRTRSGSLCRPVSVTRRSSSSSRRCVSGLSWDILPPIWVLRSRR